MKAIWKYGIGPGRTTHLTIPGFERFLAVAVQDGPVVWAVVDPDQPGTSVAVDVYLTGHPAASFDGEYLGTYQHHWFVGHVFWRVEPSGPPGRE